MSHMKWPPKVVRTDWIGEVKDVNGRKIPRDIGRPSYIGGKTYYVFGDTFCFDDRGEFVGGTNNTVALAPHPIKEPHRSQYLEKQPHVSQFVPHTKGEADWENEKEHKEKNDRVTCWPFGGVIEVGNGHGWTFFDKALTHGGTGGHHFGIGVCRVSIKDGDHIVAERVTGENMIFGENEPRFGSITHVVDDGWCYLLGGNDPNPPWDMRNHWARIRLDADFTQRQNYQFLVKNGHGGEWAPTYENNDALKKIDGLDIQAQGAVIKCPELAPEGKPFMWFGVNKFMANHLYIGCAPRPEGPWQVEDGGELPPDPAGHTGQRYAAYPHERSCNPGNGVMLVSWSDGGQMGGKVMMAKFHFEKEDGSQPEQAGHYEQKPFISEGGGQGGGDGGHHGGLKGKLKGLFN